MFQSTHSRRVRPGRSKRNCRVKKFQSTHSRRVRHFDLPVHYATGSVSIHALTKSATSANSHCFFVALFQSTHSRRVRHEQFGWAQGLFVSIHALTKSATDLAQCREFNVKVSIHALTKSATAYFEAYSVTGDVSIHALTKSATQRHHTILRPKKFQSTHSRRVRRFGYDKHRISCVFQSTHSRRVRPDRCRCRCFVVLFQSTHSRRVRPTYPYPCPVVGSCFNPRTHEECDFSKV